MTTDEDVSRSIGRRFLLGLLVVLSCALSGCGTVKIAYDHGETFVMWWVDRYVDLDATQEAMAHERVRRFIVWHRANALPEYAAFFKTLQGDARGRLTDAIELERENDVRAMIYTSISRALPDLADLALALRPEQLERTRAKFAENDQDYREKYIEVSDDKRLRDRYDLWHERMVYWYGPLSEAQEAQLRRLTDALPIDDRLWLTERQAREAELVVLLTHIARDKPPRDDVIALLAAFARRMESSPDAGRRAYLEHRRAAERHLYVVMQNLATDSQKRHAVESLQGWIDDMNEAAQEAPPA